MAPTGQGLRAGVAQIAGGLLVGLDTEGPRPLIRHRLGVLAVVGQERGSVDCAVDRWAADDQHTTWCGRRTKTLSRTRFNLPILNLQFCCANQSRMLRVQPPGGARECGLQVSIPVPGFQAACSRSSATPSPNPRGPPPPNCTGRRRWPWTTSHRVESTASTPGEAGFIQGTPAP